MDDRSYGTIPFRLDSDAIRFLLVWETWGRGHWGFPKGHPEQGETPQDTAVRELKEETGCVPERMLSHDPLANTYAFSHKGQVIQKRVEYFIVEVGRGEAKPQQEEVHEVRFVTLEELFSLIRFPELQQLAAEAHEIVVGRTHGAA